jgi:hypothetical protein
MESPPSLPFALTLHPLLPLRAPRGRRQTLDLGYQLRLVDGAALADDDVLLTALGAFVAELVSDGDAEALQHDAFAPGRRLTLLQEGVDRDGDAIVSVWDAEGIRRAGCVQYEQAAVVADGSGELRFWDPAGSGGPIALDELPLSSELVAEFGRLSAAFDRVATQGDDVPSDPMDGLEREWLRASLQARTRALWARARTEIGRSYAIGLLAPGMSRPVLDPGDPADDDEDDEY